MTKISIQPISGFPEFSPSEQLLINKFRSVIRRNFELHGFSPLETAAVERIDVLTAKGSNDKEIYAVKRFEREDSDSQVKLGLHFDLTVPLARYVSQHHGELVFPFRRWQMQPVWRHERAQAGRFRQFEQCDIDVVGRGELSIHYDAEMPAIISSIFEELEIGPFIILINNRKALHGLCEVFGVAESDIPFVIQTIDKLEKIGQDQVVSDLIDKGLAESVALNIVAFLHTTKDKSPADVIALLREKNSNNLSLTTGISELEKIIANIKALGVPDERYSLDISIARGLGYYTGTVYETKLINNPSLGSICSGGRYDDLASYFTNEKLPGVGISIGLTRLVAGLLKEGVIKSETNTSASVLVTVTGSDELSFSLELANQIRQAGINTEIYLGNKKLGDQLAFAGHQGHKLAIIIGEDELSKNAVTIKNLSTRNQKTVQQNQVIQELKSELIN